MPELSYPLRLVILCSVSLIFACNSQNEIPTANSKPEIGNSPGIHYAKGFNFVEHASYKQIELYSPWKGSNDTIRYYLYSKSSAAPNLPEKEAITVATPVQSVVCLSTTHLGYINLLGKDSSLIGIAGTKWVNNPTVLEMTNSGRIKDVGKDSHLNYELIIELSPDVVFAYGIEGQSHSYIRKLKEFGIPTVLVSEYMETDPLGKAEWIKFLAAFFELDSLAAEEFQNIEERYLEVKNSMASVASKPAVFTGLPWKGDWFVPGGKSFQATLLADAGADYVWRENEERSGMIMDIEVVFEQAMEADFWLNVNDFSEMEKLLALDERYQHFEAVKSGGVYNNNKRENIYLGNDYWESGVVKPDVVLKDLSKIFHPDLMRDHEFYYYRKLN